MAENPDTSRGTIDVLTRLAVASERLGIDTSSLQPRLPELQMAPGTYSRITLDTSDRLALRVPASAPSIPRPGDAQRELGSDGGEVAFVFGRRPIVQDLPLLAGVSPATRSALGERLGSLGDGRCDGLAHRSDGTWLAAVAHELADAGPSPTDELVAMTSRLFTITSALGVPPRQRDLLQQAHVVLAAGRGYTLWVACDHQRVIPQLTIEYRDVEWKHVVGLTDALRPETSSGPRLGVFAGAFDAPRASAFALTFRAGEVADVAISVDRSSEGVS